MRVLICLFHSGVFLHDYRVKAEGVKVRTTRQTKSNSNIKDTFYWPDMTVRRIRVHYTYFTYFRLFISIEKGCYSEH